MLHEDSDELEWASYLSEWDAEHNRIIYLYTVFQFYYITSDVIKHRLQILE